MKILILGDVCIDSNSVEGVSYESFGGPAMYISAILSKFEDSEVSIVTNYADDFVQYSSIVNLLPKSPNSQSTLQYQNIVKDGKRVQYAINRESTRFNIDETELQEQIEQADLIFFAPLIPNYSSEYIKSILKYANGNSIKVVLPQGYFRSFDEQNRVFPREFIEYQEIIQLFDFMIVSDEDYPKISDLAKEWTKQSDIEIIITKGKDGADLFYGSDWFKDSQKISVDTTPVENIIDSTGSGDIFSGSFAYMFTKTRDTVKSIQFANKIAGRCLLFTPDEIMSKKIAQIMNNE